MISYGNSLLADNRKRTIRFFAILIFILIVFIIADLIIGPVHIPIKKISGILFGSDQSSSVWRTIMVDFRIPKTITAILAGIALSISGLQMQTVFRNPLAGPDVLGISAGASLGVAVIMMGFGDFFIAHNLHYLGSWTQIVAACAGAGFVLVMVLIVSWRIHDILTILIMGILFGSAASAVVNIIQYFSSQSILKVFVVWSMGSLASLTSIQLQVLAISLCIGLTLTFLTLKIMNALMLGETYSKSMGVNIKLARILIFLSTSILSGSVTAFCGPIAFVGIAVPHLARFIFSTANHKILIPACMLLGSVILLLADIVSQIPASGVILPINTVTALLGIPLVIWVIIYNRKLVKIQ
jgi:iron complex transport system permease protein